MPEKLEMATGIRPFQYESVADINFGIDWESSSDEEVSWEYSGGYALCLLYIVMFAIVRVVAYFLSVNLLHMYTVFVGLCVAHFPLKE